MATNECKHIVPCLATHPMDVVKEELAARGLSKKELAVRMGIAASNLSRMFRERQNLTVAVAEKLEKSLDIEASFWLGLQARYNKDVEAIEQRDKDENVAIGIERMIATLLDLKVLYARLKISTALFVQDKIKRLYEAIGMPPSVEILCTICNNGEYKHSDTLTIDEKQMNTWTVLAYISAKKNTPIYPYKKGNAREAALEISRVVHSGEYDEKVIGEILSKYGISYSVVTKLEKTPIDGYSVFAGDYPAIVTTHRHDDMSCLVFNIMHELGHIELHLKKGDKKSYIAKKGDYSSSDPKEREANTFAEDILIDKETWKNMMDDANVKGLWGRNIVKELRRVSSDRHLDFGIVSWRYRHETNIYAIKGMERIPIR